MGLFDFLRRKTPPPPAGAAEDELQRLYTFLAARCGDGCDADEIPGAVGEFGLTATNPIPTHTILGSRMYLQRLATPDGQPLGHHRVGSLRAEGIKQPVDAYRLTDAAGRELAMIFICPYHRRNSEKAPRGFSLRTAA